MPQYYNIWPARRSLLWTPLTSLQQKFYFGIYVCRVTAIEDLVEQIKKSKRIAKASVIQERTLPSLITLFPLTLTHMQLPRKPAIQTW